MSVSVGMKGRGQGVNMSETTSGLNKMQNGSKNVKIKYWMCRSGEF